MNRRENCDASRASSGVSNCGVASFCFALMALPTVSMAQLDGNGLQINTNQNGFNIVGDAANEPSFAISPVDPNKMVVGWRQFDTINSSFRLAGVAFTTDGGQSWTNGGTLDPPQGSGNPQQSDPVLACDRFGRFFYNSLMFGADNGQIVYRSDDGGMTWNEPVFIVNDTTDKNWYAIDNRSSGLGAGHHYATWQFPGQFARSTDEGQTWGIRNNGASIYATIETDKDGFVHTAWWDDFSGVAYLRSENARDPNQNPTFSPKVNIPMGDLPFFLPVNPGGAAGMITIEAAQAGEPNEGTLYMLCSAIRGNDVCDVMFSRSTNGGASWSTPTRVNDDSPGQSYQWMATMSLAPGGRIDAVWFDTRDDPGHRMTKLYYTCSYDGGATWIPNRALTDAFNPLVGWPQQEKIGDYFQCLSDGGGTNIIFPATFNGEQDVYYLRHHGAWLEASTLNAGQQATFEVSDAWPNRKTRLAYSLVGRGRTNIPALGVIMDIVNPKQAGNAKFADSNGNVTWTLNVPPNASGLDVWIQSAQLGNASGVVYRQIQ